MVKYTADLHLLSDGFRTLPLPPEYIKPIAGLTHKVYAGHGPSSFIIPAVCDWPATDSLILDTADWSHANIEII